MMEYGLMELQERSLDMTDNKTVLIVTPDGYRDIIKEYSDLKCRLLYIYAK